MKSVQRELLYKSKQRDSIAERLEGAMLIQFEAEIISPMICHEK
mgnify:CR=1 FL=1